MKPDKLTQIQIDIVELKTDVKELVRRVGVQNGGVKDALNRIATLENERSFDQGKESAKNGDQHFFNDRAQTIAMWTAVIISVLIALFK